MKLNELKVKLEQLVLLGCGDFDVEVVDSVYGYEIKSVRVDGLNNVVELLPEEE